MADVAMIKSLAPQLQAAVAAEQPAWLASWREELHLQAQVYGLPDRSSESWKYTRVSQWLDGQSLACAGAVEAAPRAGLQLTDGDQAQADLPTGVTLQPLASASEGPWNEWIAELESDGVAALATLLSQGWLLRVAPGVEVDELWLSRTLTQAGLHNSLLLIDVGPEARLALREQLLSRLGSNNARVLLWLADNAQVDYWRLYDCAGATADITLVNAALNRNARLNFQSVTAQGDKIRLELNIDLLQAGAEVSLNGAYVAGDQQHQDHRVVINHRAPHCRSNTLFKGLVSDQATAVFNGRIEIFVGADDTDAQLANHNLLLSADATVNTKPELEIYADDVRCSHGATIGDLDTESLFYLRSRGLDAHTAWRLLSHGFVCEALAETDSQALAERAQAVIDQRLAELDREEV